MIDLGKAIVNSSSDLNNIRQNILQLIELLTEDKITATRLAVVTSQINRLLVGRKDHFQLSLQLDINIQPSVLSIIFIMIDKIAVPDFIDLFFDHVSLLSFKDCYQIKCDRYLNNTTSLSEQKIQQAQTIFALKSREQLMIEMKEKNKVLTESLNKIERMGAELNVAQKLQQMVLPKPEEFADIDSLDISGFMQPADEVGGDYYDVLHTDGVVTIGIGDVTGHGLESGILMLMTQTAVRTLQEIKERDPIKFLDTLNRTIFRNVQRMDSEKNLTLAILNYSAGKLSISGQHEETILVRKGGHIELIDTIDLGLPIGLDDDIAEFIDCTTLELHSGDGIVLYTDGIPEAFNLEKKQYGMDRLCKVISKNWKYASEEIKQAIINDVREFIGEQKVFDDITLLVFKQN